MTRRKLTKAERRHRRECGTTTRAALAETIAFQRKHGCRCWDCEGIARKLGVKPAGGA